MIRTDKSPPTASAMCIDSPVAAAGLIPVTHAISATSSAADLGA